AVCALVSDLYCPGYNPRQALATDSNLARAASRYKVDSAKITTAIRAELTEAKAKLPTPGTVKKTANQLQRKPQKTVQKT
ncbi:MAG TPA: hypothetical protein VGS27_06365, partial [Candidatus Sulfotelmatobacter sp.]|nr:hypothetical protein [Candidatus Sulfotelmatobacter sp.]